MARATAAQAGGDDNLRLLDLIAWSEGTSTSEHTQDDGYDVIVSGLDGWHTFSGYAQHPFAGGRAPVLVVAPCAQWPMGLRSTASGRYQLLLRIWQAYAERMQLIDFSPMLQDLVALQMLREAGALQALASEGIQAAVAKAAHLWASLPGNGYGQHPHATEVLLAKWQSLQAANSAQVA
jgi:muramidase (phage lysozyme)